MRITLTRSPRWHRTRHLLRALPALPQYFLIYLVPSRTCLRFSSALFDSKLSPLLLLLLFLLLLPFSLSNLHPLRLCYPTIFSPPSINYSTYPIVKHRFEQIPPPPFPRPLSSALLSSFLSSSSIDASKPPTYALPCRCLPISISLSLPYFHLKIYLSRHPYAFPSYYFYSLLFTIFFPFPFPFQSFCLLGCCVTRKVGKVGRYVGHGVLGFHLLFFPFFGAFLRFGDLVEEGGS